MRRQRSLGPLLISLMLLSLVVVAGCGGTATPGSTTGGPPTTASDATTTTPAVTSAGETTTTASGAATTPGSTPASRATPTSAPNSGATLPSGPAPGTPDAGTTSTFPDGMPAPITLEEIKNAMSSLGMGSPDQLQVYDYKNFGHYAAAYVMAADENVYLVLLNDETGGWAILNTITGLDWEAVQAQLRAAGAPEDLIEWANPGEG